jgi:hypothetical protein
MVASVPGLLLPENTRFFNRLLTSSVPLDGKGGKLDGCDATDLLRD